MALLGHLDIADLSMAILTGNVSLLSKVPGIGKKTAERLVVEMRDKVEKAGAHPVIGERGVISDAISALVNLGYHPAEAQKAVKKAAESEKNPELSSLISKALRG
jgi:Holliday junction DNA helicase RuvA